MRLSGGRSGMSCPTDHDMLLADARRGGGSGWIDDPKRARGLYREQKSMDGRLSFGAPPGWRWDKMSP